MVVFLGQPRDPTFLLVVIQCQLFSGCPIPKGVTYPSGDVVALVIMAASFCKISSAMSRNLFDILLDRVVENGLDLVTAFNRSSKGSFIIVMMSYHCNAAQIKMWC